ncbi:uncharacterized protein N7498_009518 [Penicillium cinerascens]|uniref:Uncharacterized protein n=1 Tax=Penicillium cinerascens TaxID=70096 RepID=A0A9W9J5M8_9EURO|nr:uncharacterized protein N7498_009518 [Penicillium cinerascens]KAJ5190533.1 hypothetical protein N7498_009518 [Penicillium cinerascens]
MQFFFPRKHRHYKVTLYLMVVEFPITVVFLTLTGIASHNLYQTFLWQDGADNGFNSAPDEALYAAANYRPYKAPMVWSSFLTNYNLVIGVLSTFLLIVKFPIHCMHLFFPPIAATIHGAIMIIYIVSASFQAGSDMSDPSHPQPGPPWYITKSCSVAAHKSNIGYCEQAKSLFAVCVIIIVVYFVEFCISVHSCFITPEEREEILEQREEKKIEKEFEEEILKSPSMIPLTPGPPPPGHMNPGFMPHHGMVPRTPGFPPTAATGYVKNGAPVSPFTRRTLGFNRLGDNNGSTSSDLPLRNNSNVSTPQMPARITTTELGAPASSMYFPPPPKKASKN